MATSDINRVTCQLCKKFYSDPILLPCLHSLCSSCFEKPASSEKQDTITCPICNEFSTIPHNGLPLNQGLARLVKEVSTKQNISNKSPTHCDSCEEATAVIYCSECSEFYCTLCRDHHKVSRKTKTHSLVNIDARESVNIASMPTQKPARCLKHVDVMLKFYCKDCSVLVCSECIVDTHRQHSTCSIDKVADERRGNLHTSLKGCTDIVASLDRVKNYGEDMIRLIMSRKKEVGKEINDAFTACKKILEQRRKALLRESDSLAIAKVTAINIQLEDVDKLKEQILFASEFVAGTLEACQASELLGVNKIIEDRLSRLKEEYKKLPRVIIENDAIVIKFDSESLDDAISQFGAVSDIYVDASTSELVSGVAVPMAMVGKKRRFRVSLRDRFGDVVTSSKFQLLTSLVSCGRGEIDVKVSIEEDQYTLTCTPDTVGEYELSVKARGIHIKNSPYRMWVRQERNLRGISGSIFCFLKGIINAAVHFGTSNVFISCYNEEGTHIHVYDERGSKKMEIGTKGSDNGQFNRPRGLVLVGDILYVVEYGNHRVQKLTVTGEYLGHFGSEGSGDGQFLHPTAIAYNGRDHIAIGDCGNTCVQVFTLDGTFVRKIPCGNSVCGVAFDNNGNLHASLYKCHQIQVYGSDGGKLFSYINSEINFNNPKGIAIDDNGYRYIVAGGHLLILDDKGDHVNVISGLDKPHGVTLGRGGKIYVAEFCGRLTEF